MSMPLPERAGTEVFVELTGLFSRSGAGVYLGEAVTQEQHALQCAHFARAAGASDALVIAALLHDVGHLIAGAPDDIAEWTSDAQHEVTGSRWLAPRFGPQVSEPVRLHVAAKRYLCAAKPAYFRRLSQASLHTLALQGGPMSPGDVAAFEAEPFFRSAVRLRHFDDRAKVAGLVVDAFEHYRKPIEHLASLAPGFGARHG